MFYRETAFLQELEGHGPAATGSRFGLRWFTPTCEVPLCGHATMATSAVLFQALQNPSDAITFETVSSGQLVVRRSGDDISMDFPLNTPVPCDAAQFQRVIELAVGKDLPVVACQLSAATKKLLVHIDCTRAQLEALSPDIAALEAAHTENIIRGVIVTTSGGDGEPGSSEYDCLSRYFAPWNGIPEDPVTGSAHTVLAGYWSEKLDRDRLRARQCSKRGGDLVMDVRAADKKVVLSGPAFVCLQGQLILE